MLFHFAVFMKDVHFEQAVTINWIYVPKLRNRHKPCIQQVANVYARNITLVKSLIELIPAIVAIAMRHGRAELSITQQMTGGRNLFTNAERNDTDNMDVFYKHLDETVSAEEAHFNSSSKDKTTEANRAITNTCFILGRYSGPALESGITALLRSTIKDTWTAIEVMAADLLRIVIETFPQCFQKVKWDDNEPKFSSRRGIKSAYERAFPVDYTDIRSAIYSDGIDAIALLRNVFVHNSGLADDDFRSGAKLNGLLSSFHNHADKQPIEIDGHIVKALIEPAIKAGCDLIMAVDTWITLAVPNPTSNS